MANGFIDIIILVTDGCSNVGGDPAEAASAANGAGITVNVIGITGIDETGVKEIQKVAQAGGGDYQLVGPGEMFSSMMSMTRASVQATLESIVSRHLEAALGDELKDLPPKTRYKALKVVEKLEDEVNLRCLVLMDTSGSMKPLLAAAKTNVIALLSGLKARKGKSLIAAAVFPGPKGEVIKLLSNFTDDTEDLAKGLAFVTSSGATPTAPALSEAIRLFKGEAGELAGEFMV
jgi:Ca-activated chloride channel family protein